MVAELEIITFKKFEKITFKLYSNGIMNVIIHPENNLFTLADLYEAMKWIESLGPNQYLNLHEGDYTNVDAAVREYIASSEANKYTIADAYLIENLADKMMGDFYIKFNKPIKPTREFTDRNEAIEWLLSMKENH